jgi:hypothetical protein
MMKSYRQINQELERNRSASDSELQIRSWMIKNAYRFRDRITQEVNMTLMVETWDIECSTGKETLDAPDHMAWEIATEFVEE